MPLVTDRFLTVFGILAAAVSSMVGFGIAVGLDPKSRGELRFVRVCFISATFITELLPIWWSVRSPGGTAARTIVLGGCTATNLLMLRLGLTWAEGRRTLGLLAAKSAADHGPDITPVIFITSVTPHGPLGNDVRVIAITKFTNRGSPGTVLRVTLDLTIRDQTFHGIDPVPIRPEQTIPLDVGDGRAMIVNGGKFWSYTVGTNPIETDGSADGFAIAIFQGVTVKQVVDNRGFLTLICSDVREHRTTSTHIFGQPEYRPPTLQ